VFVLSPNALVSNWGLFSVRGLPPFPMFFIKLFVLWSLLSQSSYTIRFTLLSGIILTTLMLSFSYIRFVFRRYVSTLRIVY
jgi:formate hydrogenlyase subunit 3/multisubunit Na+/H+ antiporter MnhD subunit